MRYAARGKIVSEEAFYDFQKPEDEKDAEAVDGAERTREKSAVDYAAHPDRMESHFYDPASEGIYEEEPEYVVEDKQIVQKKDSCRDRSPEAVPDP